MSPKKKPQPIAATDLLTVDETLAALKISRAKLYKLAAQGRLTLVKFDLKTRVTRASINRLAEEIAATPWTPAAAKKGSAA
jgi:Helix-turn-helix domain